MSADVSGPRSKRGDTVSSTAISRFDGEEHTRHFWSHYLRVGILVFTGEALATLVYLCLTPHGAHRAVLIAYACVVVAGLVANIPFTERVASSTWRTRYSFALTLIAGVILVTSIQLDGGIDSPLFVLLALPIVSAALALEVRQVIICGIATLIEFMYIWVDDAVIHRSTSEIAMFAMSLIGLVIIAVGVSNARSRLLDDEMRLRTDLATLASIDALTGCLNHGAFYDRLDTEIDRALRQGEPLSLLMIDIDFFKAFNDTYGHLAGDDALSHVGSTLVRQSRSFDAVGRVGGDEFSVILPTSSPENAAQIALRMKEALTLDHHPSVSVGYAALDPSRPSATQLVRDADRSLYEAKITGRARTPATSGSRESPMSFAGADGDDIRVSRASIEERVRATDRATAEALAILDSYQATSTVGLGFVDRDFRFVRINPMLAAIHGGSAKDHLGRTLKEIVPNLWPQLEPLYRYVIDAKLPVVNHEVSGEIPNEPGVRHSWLTNLYPVKIGSDVIGVGIVVIDITQWSQRDGSADSHDRAASAP